MRNNPVRLLAKNGICRVASRSRTGQVYACSRDVLVGGRPMQEKQRKVRLPRSGSYVNIICGNFRGCIKSQSNIGDLRMWSREWHKACMRWYVCGRVGWIRGLPDG